MHCDRVVMAKHSSSRSSPGVESLAVQVLHVAVLRRNKQLVQGLLDFGFPGDLKNARRWEPLDEAVALRDFELTRMLLEHSHRVVKSLIKAKKGSLLETLRSVDDVSFKVWRCPMCMPPSLLEYTQVTA